MADQNPQPIRKGRGTLCIERLKQAQQIQAEVKRQGRGRAESLRKLQELLAHRIPGGDTTNSSSLASTSKEEAVLKKLEEDAEGSREERRSVEKLSEEVKKLEVKDEEPATPCYYRGQSGTPLRLAVNYIRLAVEENKGVYEYEVKFSPIIDAKSSRRKLLNEHLKELSTVKVYDGGACLYLPQRLDPKNEVACNKHPFNDEMVETRLIFKKKRNLNECLHLYNVLFKRIMHILLYQRMGKNYFDPHHKEIIPQHKLEVYPGYALSVDAVEDGLMICLDTQHRVLRCQNVYQLLQEYYSTNPAHFKEFATRNIVGMVVLTRYNNNTYRIDDIAWNMTPRDKFTIHDGSEISFVDYYRRNYDIVISDLEQPLLLHKRTINVQVNGLIEKKEQMVCLIPELSQLTGLSDAMRNDFRVMKDVAMFTRVTPNQRMNALDLYMKNVEKSDEAQEVLRNWGLTIQGALTDIQARVLDTETILFHDRKSFKCAASAEWNKPLMDNKLFGPVNLINWIVFHTPRDSQLAHTFSETMCRMGKNMGCIIKPPKVQNLRDDRTDSYMAACNSLSTDVQVAVFICPTIRTDRYSVIKKICCTQIPIASQVILSKTLSNPTKLRTITHKIALQITCKLGGSLWTVQLPFKGWMICGIDVYHGSPQNSVCGFVASLNASLTKWYSKPLFQEREIGDFFKIAFANSLKEYYRETGTYPEKVVIFRDGVGDGQLNHCKIYEIKQFEDVLKEFPKFIPLTYIIVQKRIGTRMYSMLDDRGRIKPDNPPPGTVLDSIVTRRNLYDFYLIPQNVRQGTVNPTHYIVLHDTAQLKADHVQRLAYKLCHLYYNWSGTIRVPAPCLYAHKLAALVGQVIKKVPSSELDDRLYYL